jgi:predicted PurR-regulated permease PerM
MNSTDKLAELVGIILAAIIISIFLWLLFGKMGYRGKVRWYLVLSSFVPPFLAINFFVLCLITWPVWNEVRKLRKEVELLKSQSPKLKGRSTLE